MYQNYKVVVNTAAGRRRYMQYLVPPILNADIVDRYDIWVNTRNMVDIEFFKKLAQKYPKVNLVWQPDGVVNGITSGDTKKYSGLSTRNFTIFSNSSGSNHTTSSSSFM
jgi:hypothetical protein